MQYICNLWKIKWSQFKNSCVATWVREAQFRMDAIYRFLKGKKREMKSENIHTCICISKIRSILVEKWAKLTEHWLVHDSLNLKQLYWKTSFPGCHFFPTGEWFVFWNHSMKFVNVKNVRKNVNLYLLIKSEEKEKKTISPSIKSSYNNKFPLNKASCIGILQIDCNVTKTSLHHIPLVNHKFSIFDFFLWQRSTFSSVLPT